MNTAHSSYTTRIKVGIFSIFGLFLIGAITVVVNGKPFWWRPCQLVKISVEDATGLKTKSPIRSLGIEIGYLKTVMLSESRVTLGICITAPVEVLPTTRAYIRGEGFLGDKFVELKPVKYLEVHSPSDTSLLDLSTQGASERAMMHLLDWVVPEASAAESPATESQTKRVLAAPENPSTEPQLGDAKTPSKKGQEIPVGAESQDVQHLVTRVDELVHQMTGLTDNLKVAINPEQLRATMNQLNQTLANASRTLSPEGGLNQTAQRSLAKLEDAIEQLRDMMTRVNKGEGSVGMLLNDPSYAQEIRETIRNVNHLLNKVNDVRFVVDLGGAEITGYNGARAWFQLGIWPKKDRYYLLGISMDPRGRINNTTVTTTAGGLTQSTQTTVVDQTGILLTAQFGRLFSPRIDGAIGALYGDGAASLSFRLGPSGLEDRLVLKTDFYVRNSAAAFDARVTLIGQPYPGTYLRAGLESMRGYQGTGQPIFIVGAGVTFDDEDIKILFTLR